MTEDFLARLKATDPAILTEVVRSDKNDPTFEIKEWSVMRLSDKGMTNPDGLWLFSGAGIGLEGSTPWSVVLKFIQRPEKETPPSDTGYWKRELLLAQSEMTERMPGPVRAPHFYRKEETPDGIWLWMELIKDSSPGSWTLDDYSFAARQLGAWNGRFTTGIPLPDQPWLSRQTVRSWVGDINPHKSWQFPLFQQYTSADFRNRCERLWVEREVFFRVLESLPTIFLHFDSQRHNLFIRKGADSKQELVLIDWAICGLGPLGVELFNLVGFSCVHLLWPTSRAIQLADAAYDAYLQGLREVGWRGDADVVRLGFVASQAVLLGIILPAFMPYFCSKESHQLSLQHFGLAEEELFLTWLPLLSYFMDCADEARVLIEKLGFF